MIVPKLDFYWKLKENDSKYITIFGINARTKIKTSINFDNEKNEKKKKIHTKMLISEN